MGAFAVIKFTFRVIFAVISFIFQVIIDAIMLGAFSVDPPARKPKFDGQDSSGGMTRIQFMQQFGRIPNDNRN
jgi:hypothetical protein